MNSFVHRCATLLRLSRIVAAAAMVASVLLMTPRIDADEALESSYALVKPSLVFIVNMHGTKPYATGSGFVVGHRDGHMLVLTNRHVIETGTSFAGEIQAPKKLSFSLTVVKTGTDDDLALLESSEYDAPALAVATSLPALGHSVSVAGYPHTQIELMLAGAGLTPSVHAGTVNALPASGYFVQYDAQTEHGNSGGPVFDADTGLVYAIVVSKMSETNQSNFAISALRIRAFLGNAGVYPASDPDLANGPSHAPPVDSLSCAKALVTYSEVFAALSDHLSKYLALQHTASAGFINATDIHDLSGPKKLMDAEVDAITAVITNDEPKLTDARNLILETGATSTADTVSSMTADIFERDQAALHWSTERSDVIDVIQASGSASKIDQTPKLDFERLTAKIIREAKAFGGGDLCTH